MNFPEPIQRMMLEMQIEGIQRRRAAVLADPAKHKTTTEFPDGARMNSLCWRVKGKRGPEVSYHYSTERNLAGYFLAWRETWDPKNGRGKRDMLIASKRRTTVADKSRARFKAHQKRISA